MVSLKVRRPDVMIGTDDPRRWLDDQPGERRWEEIFGRLRRERETLADQANTMERRRLELVQLQDVMDAQSNGTSGKEDRTLSLNGTRAVRGVRHRQAPEGETFAEWYESVTFAAPFPTLPTVQLTVQEYGDPPPALTARYAVTLHAVTEQGFAFRVACDPPQAHVSVHWRAEGDT